MSAIEIARTNARTYAMICAQFLAISLAIAIPLSNSATVVITTILPFLCFFYMDRGTWRNVITNPTTIVILIFVALSLINAVHSAGEQKEILQALRKTSRLLYFPLLLPLFAQSKMRHYAVFGFLAAVVVSAIAAYIMRWPVFKDSIFTSTFVTFAIFTLAHYSFEYKAYRWLTIPVAGLLTYYLFFVNFGRIGQLLFIALFALFVVQRFKLKIKYLIGAGLIFTILGACITMIPSAFLMRQTLALQEIKQYWHSSEQEIPYESSMGMRLVFAHNTWNLITIKPLWGWGTGAFRSTYMEFAPKSPHITRAVANPHNQYLLTWLELGLPGLISLLLIFAALARQFAGSKDLFAYLGFGIVCVMVLGCSMNSWLLDFTSAFWFIYFAAVFAGNYKK